MNQDEIDHLIRKVLDGTASEAEKHIVDNWYRQVNAASINMPFASENERQDTKNRVFNHLQNGINGKAAVIQISRARKIAAIAAAAAAIVIGLSVYLADRRSAREALAEQVQKVSSDAPPGIKKASLTLSSGKIIELNDRAQGIIGQDGEANLVKQGTGTLVYRPLPRQTIEQVFNTMSTPRGGQYQLVLPDGTQVWLNAASSIRYPTVFTGPERNVDITGEAYLEVARDAAHPFHVQVNGVTVEVLGTSFNVNSYSLKSEIKTTLIEGKVRVSKGQATATLLPGQEGTATADKIMVTSKVDMDNVLSWKNGLFSFENAGIDEVLSEVSRWYDLDVSFEGEKPDQHYGGKIPMNLYASQMLSILEKSGVHFRIEGKKLIIMK